MTPAQSDTFILGGAAAAQVAQEITDHVVTLTTEDVLVLVDDGSVAFTLERGGAVMAVPTARQTFRAAVAQVAAKAKARLPQAVNGRIEAAVKLVLVQDVTPQADGSILVGSSTDPLKTYRLVGTACECQDFTRGQAPDGWCQHRIAAGIQKRVQELLAAPVPVAPDTVPEAFPDNDPEDPAPTAGAAPLPEAPVSITLKATFDGQEVLVTLRGHDFASVQAQVEQASAWLKAHAPTPQAPTQGKDWCNVKRRHWSCLSDLLPQPPDFRHGVKAPPD
jgi:hypothetical protein